MDFTPLRGTSELLANLSSVALHDRANYSSSYPAGSNQAFVTRYHSVDTIQGSQAAIVLRNCEEVKEIMHFNRCELNTRQNPASREPTFFVFTTDVYSWNIGA